VQNAVLPVSSGIGGASGIAERSLASRHSAYVEEVQRIIDATYAVVRRTGHVDPRVSDIVREARSSNQAFYRHFRSKDELLAAILADGRRQLVGYLEHRMGHAATPIGQVQAWIEGVLAQATNVDAAERTRPFAVHGDRLADQFPAEQQASVAVLTDLLRRAVEAAVAGGELPEGTDAERGADAVYHLAMGRMHQHLIHRTAPQPRDTEHLVGFALRGLGQET
jgi:AcrR family transcriptional regulator